MVRNAASRPTLRLVEMSVLTQPNHPARLLALFAATLAAVGVFAAAMYAGTYVWQDLTSGSDSPATGDIPAPGVDTPEGLVVLTPVDDAAAFEASTGFAPLVPARVPAGTDPVAKFAVTQPNEDGTRLGRVGFSSKRGYEREGISGPVVVVAQGRGDPGAGVDGRLKQLAGGRALGATFACGDLVLDVQLYFGPDISSGEEAITPYMRDVASSFIADIREQCG
jgi:hypothetical protein